jgi:hypothetical protein
MFEPVPSAGEQFPDGVASAVDALLSLLRQNCDRPRFAKRGKRYQRT